MEARSIIKIGQKQHQSDFHALVSLYNIDNENTGLGSCTN